ncbi:hypothetical protein H696_02832 [Fonticula alba]|uniref:Uncharacterized protein n=1 Tax=Fonticula alba TaxID=691883 RepID=A0A058Z8U4_FONAL|nr:hypothetical protein H696_02832 [Fonticula alba]KCV70491.1 hypothetical protein H696_02832 [Fonticula alba]|eukprot:XP_009495007.1 hypothetical protein H696_02832 [Fonticula alba]
MDFLLDSILAVAKELDKHEGGQLTAKIPGANTINLNSSPSLDSSTGGDSQAEESSGCC